MGCSHAGLFRSRRGIRGPGQARQGGCRQGRGLSPRPSRECDLRPSFRFRRVKYKYTVVAGAETVAGKFVKRPVVEIEISHKKQAREFLAVIDSGADNTL